MGLGLRCALLWLGRGDPSIWNRFSPILMIQEVEASVQPSLELL